MRVFFTLLCFLSFIFNASALEKPISHYCIPDSTQISCQLELALVCGPHYKDGCLTGQTTVHSCVLQQSGEPCNRPVQLLCVSGLRDGCETGTTTTHQCVPYVGPTCESNAEFSCPGGFHDACVSSIE